MKHVYATTAGGQVHFRILGSGQALVMLHDCRGSYADLMPLAELCASKCTVIMPDLPGLGNSSGPHPSAGLRAYARLMLDGLTALDVDRFHLYGVGEGAVIALQLVAEEADRVATVSCAGLDLDLDVPEGISETSKLAGIVSPREDGSHMLQIWNHIRDSHIFRPWYSHRLSSRRLIDLPSAEQLHEAVMAVLSGGSGYPDIARAVLEANRIELLDNTRSPLLLIDSPHVTGYTQSLKNVSTQTDGEHAAALLNQTAQVPLSPAPAPPSTTPAREGIWRSYAETSHGRVHVRHAGNNGRPLVLLHSAGNSAQCLEAMITRLARHRTVIAPDTLGNGDSGKPAEPRPDIKYFSQVVAQALDSLGVGSVDVWGTHTGALMGLELALSQPGRVRALIMEAPVLMSAEAVSDVLENYFPPFQIDPFGLHLVKAWHFRRDLWLFWPWYNRTRSGHRKLEVPDPYTMQPWVLNLLRGGDAWDKSYRAAFEYPTRERLPLLHVPCLICAGEGDMLADGMKEAAHIAPSCVQVRSSPATPWYPEESKEAVEATLNIYEQFFEDI